jgi:thiamine-phosphate diphosphorylase
VKRVTLCLVTDRRRLVAAGGTSQPATRCLLTQIRHAVEAGVDLIQLRERDLEGRPLAALVRDALAIVRGTATRVIVNDRVDVALACGAHGVHLRGDSIPVAAVRSIAPPSFLIGRSVHSVRDLGGSDGADYVIAGTVFASASKSAGRELLGPDRLAEIVRAAPVPVLAIGGVTRDTVAQVAAAGASGIAGIGLFMFEGPPSAGGCRACPLENVVSDVRSRFDTVISRP